MMDEEVEEIVNGMHTDWIKRMYVEDRLGLDDFEVLLDHKLRIEA